MVVVPMRVPFVTRVLVVTTISIGVAHPSPTTAVIVGLMVFRLTPAYVAILVACDANTVTAVQVAAFISVGDGSCWRKDCKSQGDSD